MKMKRLVLLAVGCALLGAYTASAATVYVSESAADTVYSTYTTGYGGQTGASGNPFGAISAAYHYLFSQGGDHEILLVGDGDGVFRGGELGSNEGANGNGYMRMVSNNQFPSGNPSWASVTLKPAPGYEGSVTLSMTDADITVSAEGSTVYPAAYEKEVPNPTGTTAANRGTVIRGLWNPGATMGLTGMIVDGLDIVIGGGHVLIGSGAVIPRQQFTFNNVNLYMQSDLVDDNTPIAGDPWLKSALFVSHATQADLDLSFIDFHDSNIYLKPNDSTAWTGNFYVGQTWSISPANSFIYFKLPNDFVDGNNSSRIYVWDSEAYQLKTVLSGASCGIWQSGRNAGNTLTAYENGGLNNTFLNNFAITAPAGDPVLTVIVPLGKTINFPDQVVFTTSGPQTITVQNSGPVSANVTLAKTGANTGDFIVTGGPQFIADSGGTASWTVTFAPGAEEGRSASIVFTATEGGTGDSCAVLGNGTAGLPVPILTVTTPDIKSITFSDREVGETSVSQIITVENSGDAPATVLPVKTGDTGDFDVLPAEAQTIAEDGGEASWTVTFSPTTAGARSASVNFAADQGGGTDSCAVGGNGTFADPGLPAGVKWVDPNLTVNGVGTFADPFASIEAAYASVWSSGGTIMLKPGTYDGANIGAGNYINWYSLSAPGGSITLAGYMPAYTTIAFDPAIAFDPDSAAFSAYYDDNAAPIFGLWNSGNFDTGNLIVKDMTITVASGGVLIGNSDRSLTVVKFDFQNVDVYLNNGANGVSALFDNAPATTATLSGSYIKFSDSDLYWGTTEVFVGRTYGVGTITTGYIFPEAFVNGNSSSSIHTWNGSAYVPKTTLIGGGSVVWQGARNIGIGNSTIRYRQNGANENGADTIFLKNFLPSPLLAVTVPVPSSIDFGNVIETQTSGPQTITVQNNGTVAATVTPAKTGTDTAEFDISGTKVIGAGSSESWTVTFTPGGLGTRGPTTVTFSASEGGTTDTCDLSGTGVTPPTPPVPGTVFRVQ